LKTPLGSNKKSALADFAQANTDLPRPIIAPRRSSRGTKPFITGVQAARRLD